jgi:hypothetical protein
MTDERVGREGWEAIWRGCLESTERLLEEGDPHPVDELAGRRSGRAVEQLKRLRPLAAQLREKLKLPPAGELGAEVEEEPS